MTVKRTELEILNKAIEISETRTLRIKSMEKLASTSACMCEVEERKFKKNDMEGIKKYYQEKMRCNESNIRGEMNLENQKKELLQEILGLSQQLDLLRWLYKDNNEVQQ